MLENFKLKKSLEKLERYAEDGEFDILGRDEPVFEDNDCYMNRISIQLNHNSSQVHKEVIGVYWNKGRLKKKLEKKAVKRVEYMKETVSKKFSCDPEVDLMLDN